MPSSRRSGLAAALLLASVAKWGCGSPAATTPTAPVVSAPGSEGGNGLPVGTTTRGPYLQHAEYGIAVVWYTASPTEGRVRWRVGEETTGEAVSSAGLATRHEAVIAPLAPGARYTYEVRSAQGVLAGAGGAAEFSFLAPTPGVLRFVVFGDSGEGSPGQQAVARAIEAEAVPPDLVLIVGDVNQPPPSGATQAPAGEGPYDARFFEPYQRLLPAIPFYAALGNHDYEVENGRAFLDVFTLPRNGPPGLVPESSWWLERAGALMIVHDTNQSPSVLKTESAPWHAAVARRPAAFRLVFQHHPVFGSGPNAALYPSDALRDLLAPLYTTTGIDVVFSGHDHLYERTRPIGGVVYVTTGAGGGELYPRTTRNGYTAAFVNDRHSYTYVEVRGRTMLLRQRDTSGTTIDTLEITKPVAASRPEAVRAGFARVLRARRAFDRRGADALALEGAVDGTEASPPSLELSLVSSPARR